ncbi:hypothetical protein ACT4YX_18080 [Acinetobacter baumannii]|uniref:hypothetical protein n=1 Tax=Acinetobacter baumannii TaxID=470 RepID=UPI0002EA70E8|nr:hypothetical protein [Acinetobacter baumannii]EHU2107564.1 hypothetical protein [Acinetobacter baumannii]MCZ3182570.1 hypothetical protein [Acinetobacter baumannii]MDC5065516.1 hypothetical protein [Acinetobacter baumannii]MDI7720215.1 hypothetical protein [Acinetobacter baumannii]HCH8072464.1 hypothetical protein [Acinetobacter baumannii]
MNIVGVTSQQLILTLKQEKLRTPEQIQMFREALDPKSGHLIPLDPIKVPKK